MNNQQIMFDQTGAAPQALSQIYTAADNLLEAWGMLVERNEYSGLAADAMVLSARKHAAEFLDLSIRLHAFLQRAGAESPDMAPSRSATVALDALAKFASALVVAYQQDAVEDAVHSISDVAFDMLRHDHAKAFAEAA